MSLPPEYELLLDAVHARSRATDTCGWDAARWDVALRLAAWHRLSPVLFAHIAERAQAPPKVLAVLEQAYLENAGRNLFVRGSLQRVLQALDAAAIPVVLLKGAALIQSVYTDPALREMLDLDILVPVDRLDAANAALGALGFAPATAATAERDTPAWMRANHIHDPALASDQQITAVELHHHIAIDDERTYFPIDGLWTRACKAPDGAHLLPSPEDLLLHVCFHFTRNRAGRSDGALGQICDIAWIVRRERLDWDLMAAIAHGYSLQSRVFLALFAARELGAEIPDQAMSDLRPPDFDPRLGRRLVELRVLRDGPRLPVRSLRWMVAPPRGALVNAWNADPDSGVFELARAYVRRAAAQLPQIRSALRQPRSLVQDHRLNGQISALERRERVARTR